LDRAAWREVVGLACNHEMVRSEAKRSEKKRATFRRRRGVPRREGDGERRA
jgi:hypothetical protein